MHPELPGFLLAPVTEVKSVSLPICVHALSAGDFGHLVGHGDGC